MVVGYSAHLHCTERRSRCCVHLFRHRQKGDMGTVMSFTQTPAGGAINAVAMDSTSVRQRISRRTPLVGAYVSLLLFMVVYCARPEDWIPGLSTVPLAKLTGAL